MIINHNIPALNTFNKLTANNSMMAKSLEKLSSGLRINRAADDAAGLAISEKMRSQIRGLDQATRNAQDGISLIQTAEGALQETHSILQRMRELAVQAANDTYTAQDRQEIQKEIDQLADEIDRISNTTEFNTKKLLNGDSAAYVSSDKLTTKIFMRDGLRVEDQFGQKSAGGGNYKVEIEAVAGQNQVQKTDIFKVKHESAVLNVIDIDTTSGLASAQNGGIVVNNMLAGSYEIFTTNSVAAASALVTLDGSQYFQKVPTGVLVTNAAVGANTTLVNASTLFTVSEVTLTGLTLKYESHQYDKEGKYELVEGYITVEDMDFLTTAVDTTLTGANSIKNLSTLSFTLATGNQISVGDKFVINNSARAYGGDDVVEISNGKDTYKIVLDAGRFDKSVQDFKTFGVDSATGLVKNGEITLKFSGNLAASAASYGSKYSDVTGNDLLQLRKTDGVANTTAVSLVVTSAAAGSKSTVSITGTGTTADPFKIEVSMAQDLSIKDLYELLKGNEKVTELIDLRLKDEAKAANTLVNEGEAVGDDTTTSLAASGFTNVAAKFDYEGQKIGDLAKADTKLYDIDKFWDANGNFILANPQTITLVQGDGTRANLTISGADTIQDVVNKLNQAIGVGLGQQALAGVGASDFVSFVEKAAGSLESVAGTFVVRSALTGDAGKITFVGADDVLAALSLATIQEAKNNNYTVNVTDAHSGKVVAQDVKVATNMLNGVVHQNVDVEFATNSGLVTQWDEATKNFKYVGGAANMDTTYVHLADNTLILHIGANQKQDIAAGIANMSAKALGVNNVQVTNNEVANEAIGKIDSAISRVSSERSKLGALQNRLDHTINNLTTTAENLTAAESRIRDVDMAKEMINFTKYQILANAATSMLAQANQMPQSVLQLLR